MPDRRETLRKLLEKSGAKGLTQEQYSEILAHLEDSVEAKVTRGMGEEESIARALHELGDLRRIIFELPSGDSAVTPEGWRVRAGSLEGGFVVLLAFIVVQVFLSIPLIHLCMELGLQVPGISRFFMDVGEGFLADGPIDIPVVLAAGWVVIRLRRHRLRKGLGIAVTSITVTLFLASVLALALPILNLLSRIGG